MKKLILISVLFSLIFAIFVSAEYRPFNMVDYDSCSGWSESAGDYIKYNDLGWYDCSCSSGSSGNYWVDCNNRDDACSSNCCPGASYCPAASTTCDYSTKYECYNNDRVLKKTCTSGNYASSIYKWCSNGCPQGNSDCSAATTVPSGDTVIKFNSITVSPRDAKVNEWITVTTTFEGVTPGNYIIEAGIERVGSLAFYSVTANECNPDEQWYANKLVSITSTGSQTAEFKVRASASGKYLAHVALVSACGGNVLKSLADTSQITISAVTGGDTSGGDTGNTDAVAWDKILLYGIIGLFGLVILMRFTGKKR